MLAGSVRCAVIIRQKINQLYIEFRVGGEFDFRGNGTEVVHPKPPGEPMRFRTPAPPHPQSLFRSSFFDERKIVVLRSDASDKTAKQNESDDHFRLTDNPGVNNPATIELNSLG